MFAGLIGAATAGTLWWDFEDEYGLWVAVLGLVALAVISYATVRYLQGRTVLIAELAAFTKLKRLRQELGLDDPRALLP
jgi:hypothetical protein